MPVPQEEASRFGIVVTDENGTDHGVPGEAGASEEQSGIDGNLHIQLEGAKGST